MSNAEGLDAMRKAATCGYKPVVAAAGGARRARDWNRALKARRPKR